MTGRYRICYQDDAGSTYVGLHCGNKVILRQICAKLNQKSASKKYWIEER